MTAKTYEQMTPEERDARNEAAFTWKESDLLWLDPNTREWLGDEEFLRRARIAWGGGQR